MRKKLLMSSIFITIFAAIFFITTPKSVSAEETKGFRVEQVFSDKFNKEALDPSWNLNGATLELNYNGLHCISPVSYGAGPIINAVTLSDRTQINFTIYPQTGQSATNISFNIGMESPSTPQKEPDVDCKVQFWNDQLVFTNWQHNLAVDHDKEAEHVLRGFKGLFSDLLRTDVSLFIERKSNTQTYIYAEYSRDDEVVYSSKSSPFILENPRQPYGYCGFFWDVVEMDLTNFQVYNDDKLVFEDDFSENTLTYPSTDASLGNFHINTTLNESQCYVSRVSSVLMDSASESIVNKNSLIKLENVSTPYELKYSIKINTLKDNSFFGFGFGLDDTDTSIDMKNAIGFIKNDNLTAEVIILKNGVIDRSNAYQVSLTKLGNGKYLDYSITLDAANNAYLSFNGLTYKFSNINFYGETGIGLVDLESSEASSAEMREFSLKRNVYNKYSSEDASNDFKGTRVPDEDDPLYTEPYINNQKYFLGSGVSLEEDWTTGDAELTFTSVGPYSGFGYCKEFSEWVLEFDIELFTRNNNQMFGVSFGRKSIVDVLLQASTSCNSFLFRCDGASQTGMVAYGANCKFEDGSTSKTNPVNVFDAENNKYHMMFIGKNRSLYVYYKAIDAPDSELGILRAKITDVNIDGYVSIVGNNNISFGISNYKIVNLSDACTTESELTLRESFTDSSKVSDKISLDSMSRVQDEKLYMMDSNVQTTSKNLFEMIRFTTYEVESSLQIMFSEDKRIIFDKEKGQITIKEGNESTSFDATEMNLDYIKGKRFEIMILGDTLTVSYKGHYDPLDKLSTTLITYTFKSPLSEDYITFSANGKVVLDDLYLFSLDNSKECLTLNYEDDPNNATIWRVKPDFDPSKVYKEEEPKEEPVEEKGCKSIISASIVSLVVLGVIPIIMIKKRKEER